MPERMKPYLPSAVLLFLIAYLGVQALTGSRGLLSGQERDALLRQLTTSPSYEVAVGSRVLQYNNTNGLVRSPDWDIGLQKTGYISEAGRCLVMQARVAGRKLIMVFLDSTGKYSRLGDAERVRRWVELQHHANTAVGSALAG